MKKLIKILLLSWIFCGAAIGQTFDVTVSWDPNSEADLLGYKVYYGTSSQSYTQIDIVGLNTEYIVKDLPKGVWYFAVTAYDTIWNESDFSNEVNINIDGVIIPPDTTVTEDLPGLELYQNYPNPFSGSTVISFSVDKGMYVDMTIYNVRGRQMFKFSEYFEAGHYSTVFDGHNLAPGVYICQLQTKRSTFLKKMMKF